MADNLGYLKVFLKSYSNYTLLTSYSNCDRVYICLAYAIKGFACIDVVVQPCGIVCCQHLTFGI